MMFCSLRSCMAVTIVASAMLLQSTNAKAGVHVYAGPVAVNVSRGYVYTPYSYPVANPAYAAPPVLITSQRYPYYAVPQPVYQTTYYRPSPVSAAPVVYTPPGLYYSPPVVGAYYRPYFLGGRYTYKVKYRRGLFHDYVKYKIEYND